MTSRRVPLADVPNAANSPFRGGAKRTRDQLDTQADFPWDVQPSAKRQVVDLESILRRTSPRKVSLATAEARVFSNKRSACTPPTAFERQLLAVKDDKPQQRVDRQEKSTQRSAKDIKQWQEHYRKAFPSFVFYFENIGEEVRSKCSKYARMLGAVSRVDPFYRIEADYLASREKRNSFPKT